ncbi:MAG: MjaI family restriction endonuclease [Candidatus Methanomethyliaceae archaeon]
MNPPATKEFILNYAMNRWQLNFKRNVGPTSETIRKCMPNSLDEWKDYYYSNIRSREHIDNLGKVLYRHIKEDLPPEKRFHPDLIASITETDCIVYMHDIVIKRTYEGYVRERGRKIF